MKSPDLETGSKTGRLAAEKFCRHEEAKVCQDIPALIAEALLAACPPLFILRAVCAAAGGHLAAPQAVAERKGRYPGIAALGKIVHVVK
jgi:hypothetical protein